MVFPLSELFIVQINIVQYVFHHQMRNIVEQGVSECSRRKNYRCLYPLLSPSLASAFIERTVCILFCVFRNQHLHFISTDRSIFPATVGTSCSLTSGYSFNLAELLHISTWEKTHQTGEFSHRTKDTKESSIQRINKLVRNMKPNPGYLCVVFPLVAPRKQHSSSFIFFHLLSRCCEGRLNSTKIIPAWHTSNWE